MTTQIPAHTYTIKEVSQLTGLPSSTLRYYETIGIVKPIERDASSKQRVYSGDDLAIIDAIACLNATGMSLKDMKAYIANRDHGAEGAAMQIQLLENQNRQLKREIERVALRQKYVELKISYWQNVKAGKDEQAKEIAAEARKLTYALKHPEA